MPGLYGRTGNTLPENGSSCYFIVMVHQPMQAVANTNETQETADIQQQKVKTIGVVVDENGEPLIGVSVKVQGTATGTVTDLNGRFSIDSPKEQFSHFRLLVIKLLP